MLDNLEVGVGRIQKRQAAFLARKEEIVDNDAVVRYWDANGTQAGAGFDQTGTWGTDNFWSTSADGTATPGPWMDWAMAPMPTPLLPRP